MVEKHAHLKCECAHKKVSHEEWTQRLRSSDIDTISVRNIVELEGEALTALEVNLNEAIDDLLDEYERKQHLKFEDLSKGIEKHYDLVMRDLSQPMALYYRGLVNSSREDAYADMGMEREARRKLIRLAAVGKEDVVYEKAIDRAFTKVRTVSKSVIEELKDRWIENGGPIDIVRSFLLDKEEELRAKPLTRDELREKLRQLWVEKRYILQRIIRTETVNTHAAVQLREWYDQGFREVERIEINDIKTCSLCRTLALPGRNIYQIEDLLEEEYPVTFCSHPQCRGNYRLRVNLSILDEFDSKVEDFVNAQDIEMEGSVAKNVPLEYQVQVEKALKDFGPDYGIKFVPDITDSEEWKKDRLNYWLNFYDERDAQIRVDMEVADNRGKYVQYTTDNGEVLVSGDAGELNRIVVPILREKARQSYLALEQGDQGWIVDTYDRKKKEMGFTLENEGIQIFGKVPFISPLAENSAQDYFIESYTSYVSDPIRLLYLDRPMYDFIRAKCISNEYLLRGGLK